MFDVFVCFIESVVFIQMHLFVLQNLEKTLNKCVVIWVSFSMKRPVKNVNPPNIRPAPETVNGAFIRNPIFQNQCHTVFNGIIFFLASLTAFLIALGTSFAFPKPQPTLPFLSPVTTNAPKFNFLPRLRDIYYIFLVVVPSLFLIYNDVLTYN